MSYSTLYGVNSKNELIELKTYQNSHLACFPAWNYLEQKYFGVLPSLIKPKCWDLEKKDMDDPSEYMVLLSTFDGYTVKKENLSDIISLLKKRQDVIPNLSRLQMFEDALSNEMYDHFFITATSLADYEHFMTYHFDEEGLEKTSPPTLTNEVWDIWEAYQE
jgi:hypothetical protein